MRLGIYVGSFNPPHEGHHKVMKYLLEKNLVDKVLLLPTPNYWDKTDLVNVNERIEMLKFYEEENIIVDSIHNNYPYTYEVLRSLKKDYPEDELYLVIGSDNLEKFHEWKNIDEILENKVIVLNRGEIIKNKYLENYNNQFIYINDFDYIEVSSTDIRNGNNKNIDNNIKKYIEEHNLYENI
ncbi:MAG: nicotinate-nicotinamide nucleotide adenylyltransferase [Bacilli bacterium]|nr:nicotinate-nicotinamide nucleotide adenylyltransferase [Bacilli bacterium]MBR6137773.1 nicotinate-nicotinamide nucleotide adenylyltransferase [Bacilli bacterium]